MGLYMVSKKITLFFHMFLKMHNYTFVCKNITQIEAMDNNHNIFQSPTGAS